jgi:hypothetical protein
LAGPKLFVITEFDCILICFTLVEDLSFCGIKINIIRGRLVPGFGDEDEQPMLKVNKNVNRQS